MHLLRAALLGAVFLAASALAQGAAVDVQVEAHDDEAECDSSSYCFEVTSGDLDAIEAGDEVLLRFENAGSTEHEIVVAPLGAADPDREDTALGGAIDEIEGVPAGESGELTFTVPDDAEGLYFWCDLPGHEKLGMHTETDFAEEESTGIPVPAWLALLAGVAAALAFGRRPRSR